MAEIEWKTKEENEKSQPSELETLKKQQTDLVFTLLINGVI